MILVDGRTAQPTRWPRVQRSCFRAACSRCRWC